MEKRTLIVLRARTDMKTKGYLGECSWAFSFFSCRFSNTWMKKSSWDFFSPGSSHISVLSNIVSVLFIFLFLVLKQEVVLM